MPRRQPDHAEGLWTLHNWVSSPTWQQDQTRVLRCLRRLPKIEADMVRLFYFDRLSQATIAAIFDVKQPSVHGRLLRACERLRFLLAMPPRASARRMIDVLRIPARDADLIRLMWQTTSQSETGRRLGCRQNYVRVRFLKVIRRLRERPLKKEQQAYVEVLERIRDRPGILASPLTIDSGGACEAERLEQARAKRVRPRDL